MAKTEHSKIPWGYDPNRMEITYQQTLVDGSMTSPLCRMTRPTTQRTREIQRANAEFIVTAANSFYPMLEALKEAFSDMMGGKPHLTVITKVQEAIKNAEGEG